MKKSFCSHTMIANWARYRRLIGQDYQRRPPPCGQRSKQPRPVIRKSPQGYHDGTFDRRMRPFEVGRIGASFPKGFAEGRISISVR